MPSGPAAEALARNSVCWVMPRGGASSMLISTLCVTSEARAGRERMYHETSENGITGAASSPLKC
eukprot:2566720-Pyramimonas_sp.AAC.1